ncbi:MAG: hypothetical protein SFY32_02705 [Bacteroidota bacterium]|nr:hypothetical protein [Bacteroidota bacterium]
MSSKEKLIHEKLRGYKGIVIGQFSILIIFLFAFPYFTKYPFPYYSQVLLVFISILLLVINYLSFELLKDLTDSKFIVYLVVSSLTLAVVLQFLDGISMLMPSMPSYQFLMLVAILLSLVPFLILLYLIFNDIFREKHDIVYRLWGCACIYLLFGVCFCLIYTMFAYAHPLEFGKTKIDIYVFVDCYNYSFYTLAGIDSPFPNFSNIVKNLSVIESVFSNLYVILVVGRLLSK